MPGVLMKGRAGEAHPPGFPWQGPCWGDARGRFGVRGSAWGDSGPTSGASEWSQPRTHLTGPCPRLSLPTRCNQEPRRTPLGLFFNEMLSRSLNIRQEAFFPALAVPHSGSARSGQGGAETRCPTPAGTRGPFRSKTAVSSVAPAAIFNTDALLRFK